MMSFSFLAPLFLAGFAAVAIPILVHLTHRERRDTVLFPSLMFVRRVPFRTVRRQRIRHWLLLLLRAAAVVLLVAAFARPLLDTPGLGSAALGTAREVVILLDRSSSMGFGDRWTRATEAATRAVDGLGPADRATIVLFADRAEAVNQATGDAAALRATIDAARPSSRRTQYGPALQLARDILEASELPRREVLFVTDFQRAGWQGQQDLRLPDGTTLSTVDVGEDALANVAVTGASVERVGTQNRGSVTVLGRIANLGTTPIADLDVTLEIDGRAVAAQTIAVPANGAASLRFAAVSVPGRETRGRMRISGDGLPTDDVFHFVVAPPTSMPILIVRHPSAGASELLYLREALAIGFDPSFDVAVTSTARLGAGDFEGRALVVLYDTPFPQGAVGARLTQFVRDGGGLFVVLGRRTGGAAWTTELSESLGTLSTPTDRLDARGGTVSILDYRHPLFEPFGAPRSGDFSAARFFRYHRYQPGPTSVVLARFDDGAVALAETPLGEGRVMVWTSGLSNQWNNLPVQPVFLPLMHQLGRHLSHYRPTPIAYVAGHVIDVDHDAAVSPRQAARATPEEIVVETPSGQRFPIAADADSRTLELEEHGFYLLRTLATSDAPQVIAANPDPVESDLTPLDREELIGAIAARDLQGQRAAELAAALTPTQKERRQGLWWYILIAALFVLVSETLLAGRLTRGNPSRPRSAET